MGLEIEWLEPELGMSLGFFFAQWQHHPVRGEVRSQAAGAEALKVESELTLLPLSCVFPPLPALAPSPQRRVVLEQERPEQVPYTGCGACWGIPRTPVRIPDCSLSAASMSTSDVCPCPIWMLCQVQDGSVPHNCALSLSMVAFTLVWSCIVEGPE